MKREDAHLIIDAFTPETLPMERLAKYLQEFADLLGNRAFVHFSRVEAGSTDLVAKVQETAFPKVERRLRDVVEGTAATSAMKARKKLDDLLAEDNAIGHVALGTVKVIEFPGRRRASQERIGPVRRPTTVEGQIFSIGGRDETINVHLRDKGEEIRAEVSIALARELTPHFLFGKVRLSGEADWYRIDSRWVMGNFTATSYTLLRNQSLADDVSDVRKVFRGVDPRDFSSMMDGLRRG